MGCIDWTVSAVYVCGLQVTITRAGVARGGRQRTVTWERRGVTEGAEAELAGSAQALAPAGPDLWRKHSLHG